jgi:hypothetical protein
MRITSNKSLILVLGLCLLFVAFGCAPLTKTVHPEFETRTKDIKTTGLLSPDIKIYEFTAGGVRELKDDWCVKGKENVQRAMIEGLGEKPLEVKPIIIEKETEEEMEDIYALYRAVSTSIILHTRGENKFPEKIKNFSYSVGSVENILKRYGVDTLIFVTGLDEISTAGRKALTAAGIIAGALTGVMVIPRSGITVVSVAMVDPSGAILWYNIKGSQGGYDLRNPESATKLVREILADYPGVKK